MSMPKDVYLDDLTLAKQRPWPTPNPLAPIEVVADAVIRQHVHIPCWVEADNLNEGSPCYEPHTLLGSQRTLDPYNNQLIYQCQTCGAKRVFGMVGNKTAPYSLDEDE